MFKKFTDSINQYLDVNMFGNTPEAIEEQLTGHMYQLVLEYNAYAAELGLNSSARGVTTYALGRPITVYLDSVDKGYVLDLDHKVALAHQLISRYNEEDGANEEDIAQLRLADLLLRLARDVYSVASVHSDFVGSPVEF